MEKKGYSHEGFWGETIHYDADGNKVGESRKNGWGGYDHFDADGNKVGSSHKNFWGGVDHHNANGEKVGNSNQGFWGQTNHYDNRGNKIGESTRNFSGGQNHYESQNESTIHSNYTKNRPTYSAESRGGSVLDTLLLLLSMAGFILFILGALLRWEDVLWYFLIFIVSFVLFVIRNK